jgi:DNA polymerase/3'-5' exonuclease PolX
MSHISVDQRISLEQARPIAEEVRQALAPCCTRLEVAGSIRRQRPTIGDIEIVAIPKQVPAGLFGDESTVHPAFCQAVNQWPAVKGQPTGKHTQRILPGGVKLDLFMADADNWGLILVIRTGSWAFSRDMLGAHCKKRGYKSIEGRLTRLRDGQVMPIREEAELFALLGVPYVEPPAREV